MSVWGICRAKDEADIIEATVGHMVAQVDHVLVDDNDSTDGTAELARAAGAIVCEDSQVAYYQSERMSRMAARAFEQGATFVVPFDADEVWLTCNGHERIADTLTGLPAEALIADAAVLDHVATGEGLSEWRRAEQLPLRKVACRAVEGVTIHQGNHGASFPNVAHPLTVTGLLQVRHFPYRSPEQMVRKARNGAAAYAATDLPEEVGKHWRDYGRLSDGQIFGVFHEFFWSDDPERDGLVHDPCPLSR